MGRWATNDDGVVMLPSGRRVRGRESQRGWPGGQVPEFGVYLLGADPRPLDWPSEWVQWGGAWPPVDRVAAEAALLAAWHRCADERVEVVGANGRGRTGLALACLAVVDGARPAEAVRIVEEQYEGWAVGTPWKRWFIGRFARDVA